MGRRLRLPSAMDLSLRYILCLYTGVLLSLRAASAQEPAVQGAADNLQVRLLLTLG